ncbi:MAG TPA: MBL fold metallo-hydrolase [Bacteroidia bacterium]|nr:MBL fold metallo-hydrolase [Bacteroidia bacterium]
MEKITIQFLGAAGTVTGSKYLLKAFGKNILVDCGLFQGLEQLRLMNWDELPFSSSEIDAVLLTHGHLDHCGYLPRLVKSGFNKNILATEPTLEITKVILEDSARIQEEDAERANREGFSKHKPAKPLYDSKDVERTLPHFSAQPLDKWIDLFENIYIRFRYNGHIIGATFIEMKIGNKLFVFSGDIGRENDLLMYPPQKPEQADVLFIESTYGNKLHQENAEAHLAQVINEAAQRHGTIIIPSFAVERTQLLMYLLWQLRKKNMIPDIPLYMDSPMGKNVLDIFHHNKEWHKLPIEDCNEMCKGIIRVQTIQDTMKLARQKNSKIIIAGSGMASGGRVLTYFQNYLGDENATILLVGYQAEGTRGRSLLDGASEIKLYGKYYPIKARTVNIEGLSAHADQRELIDWLSNIKNKPDNIFIVHGEKEGAEGLKNKIKEVYQWDCEIPELYQMKEINLSASNVEA